MATKVITRWIFHEQNIKSGFEAAGLVPFDPDRVISALDITEIQKTPTPNPELPPATWTSKTPTNTRETESQSTLIKDSIVGHQGSSPTPIIDSIDSIAKATHAIMHEVAVTNIEQTTTRVGRPGKEAKRHDSTGTGQRGREVT